MYSYVKYAQKYLQVNKLCSKFEVDLKKKK